MAANNTTVLSSSPFSKTNAELEKIDFLPFGDYHVFYLANIKNLKDKNEDRIKEIQKQYFQQNESKNPIDTFEKLKLELEIILRHLLSSKRKFESCYEYFKESFQLDINVQDSKTGYTFLHLAAIVDDILVFKWLIETPNIDVFIQDCYGNLAMDIVTKKKGTIYHALTEVQGSFDAIPLLSSVEIFALWEASANTFKGRLKSKRINPNSQNKQARNLLFSLHNNEATCTEYQSKLRFLFEEYGANVNLINIHDPNKGTLVHSLIMQGREDSALDFLILASRPRRKNLLNPNMRDLHGRTTLMLSIAFGFNKLVNAILKRDLQLQLDIDAEDKDGFTALHFACLFRNENAVKLLLSKKASLLKQDKRGNTPVQYLNATHHDIIESIMKTLAINSNRAENACSNTVQGMAYILPRAGHFAQLLTKTSAEQILKDIKEHKDRLKADGPTLLKFLHSDLNKFGIILNKEAKKKHPKELYYIDDIRGLRPCRPIEYKAFKDLVSPLSDRSIRERISCQDQTATILEIIAKALQGMINNSSPKVIENKAASGAGAGNQAQLPSQTQLLNQVQPPNQAQLPAKPASAPSDNLKLSAHLKSNENLVTQNDSQALSKTKKANESQAQTKTQKASEASVLSHASASNSKPGSSASKPGSSNSKPSSSDPKPSSTTSLNASNSKGKDSSDTEATELQNQRSSFTLLSFSGPFSSFSSERSLLEIASSALNSLFDSFQDNLVSTRSSTAKK